MPATIAAPAPFWRAVGALYALRDRVRDSVNLAVDLRRAAETSCEPFGRLARPYFHSGCDTP